MSAPSVRDFRRFLRAVKRVPVAPVRRKMIRNAKVRTSEALWLALVRWLVLTCFDTGLGAVSFHAAGIA